jgi:hypothetical protein
MGMAWSCRSPTSALQRGGQHSPRLRLRKSRTRALRMQRDQRMKPLQIRFRSNRDAEQNRPKRKRRSPRHRPPWRWMPTSRAPALLRQRRFLRSTSSELVRHRARSRRALACGCPICAKPIISGHARGLPLVGRYEFRAPLLERVRARSQQPGTAPSHTPTTEPFAHQLAGAPSPR